MLGSVATSLRRRRRALHPCLFLLKSRVRPTVNVSRLLSAVPKALPSLMAEKQNKIILAAMRAWLILVMVLEFKFTNGLLFPLRILESFYLQVENTKLGKLNFPSFQSNILSWFNLALQNKDQLKIFTQNQQKKNVSINIKG